VKNWQKILIPTLIMVAIGAIYLFSVYRHRQDPGVIGQKDLTQQTLSQDDLVVTRSFFPAHYEDLQRLVGTTVWMRNGYTIAYFPFAGGKVDFGEKVGLIPSAQRLEIEKIVKAVAPAKVDDGIGHGDRQVLAVFALPGSPALYATPIGTIESNEEAYYPDMLFFYDDPHTIYDHWPKEVWAAVDAHQPKAGMSEAEVRMAIGQKMHVDGPKEGDRKVTYDQDGKHWTVTFQKNRATEIKSE